MILQWHSFEMIAKETFEVLLHINGYFPVGAVQKEQISDNNSSGNENQNTQKWGQEYVNSTQRCDTSPEGETSTNRFTFKQVPCSNGDANPCHTPRKMGSGSHCTQVASNMLH